MMRLICFVRCGILPMLDLFFCCIIRQQSSYLNFHVKPDSIKFMKHFDTILFTQLMHDQSCPFCVQCH